MKKTTWTRGNRVELLENGDAYFPRVFDAIAGARQAVIVETFILFDDAVGRQLHAALLAAAANGAMVDLLVDGYGSPDLSPAFIGALTAAGIRVRIFDPAIRLFGARLNIFRRMHRKIVVVDGVCAFVGGINFSEDHLMAFGPMAKQDYAVALAGPIVAEINRFAREAIERGGGCRRGFLWPLPTIDSRTLARSATAQGSCDVWFVTRDNWRHTTDIEKHYLAAIRTARRRVVIANAYFFPGYRVIRALRRAARRGVDVQLVLQGEPDMQFVKTAASMLYHHLVRAGVRIYEYRERPLHGKVALVDDTWSTVGSSNLDPLSLSLNLEANVMIRDGDFNALLAERLRVLIETGSQQVGTGDLVAWSLWRVVRSFFVFHFLRLYPSIGVRLPRHAPTMKRIGPDARPEVGKGGSTTTDTA